MFQRLMNTIQRFMVGRYGTDQLNRFLFVVYLIVWLAERLIGGWILLGLLWAVMVLLLFRTLSRDIPRRQAENQWFLRWWNPVKGWFARLWTRLKDSRYYRYRKCPGCNAQLRLPVKRGYRTVTCARCRYQFKSFFL